jgi:hypothetical protein
MAREGTVTFIEPGMIQRLVQGVRYALSGVRPDEWFGPGQPIQPVAQEQAKGRAFDFPVNQNIRITPRAEEAVGFPQMRALADAYDFLRLVIETRKDQVCCMKWTVRPIDPKQKPDDRCRQIEAFLAMPDQEHNWSTWLRMLLEDMLVLDAATIYPRMTRGGGLYALELVDGATVRRVIDATGRTPLPPDPAYQQIIKGLPAVNYSRDELFYLPRNKRTNRVYGYSPVEQIIVTTNIALRRQVSQLQYFTEGNIPEAMVGVPETWNPDQIRMFQNYWDEMLEGNTGARRRAKFIPGGMDIHETRPNLLKDEFDEWLVRLICFAFGVNPNNMIAQVNRATAEVNKASADEEGLTPVLQWVKSVIDPIIARAFLAPDLHFEFSQRKELDPLTQAQVHKTYIDARVLTADEVRDELGRDPLTDEQREQLTPVAPPGLKPGGEDENEDGEPTGKAAVVHNHISVQPPDVLVDVGATTIHADFGGGGAARKTVTADRAGGGRLVGTIEE